LIGRLTRATPTQRRFGGHAAGGTTLGQRASEGAARGSTASSSQVTHTLRALQTRHSHVLAARTPAVVHDGRSAVAEIDVHCCAMKTVQSFHTIRSACSTQQCMKAAATPLRFQQASLSSRGAAQHSQRCHMHTQEGHAHRPTGPQYCSQMCRTRAMMIKKTRPIPPDWLSRHRTRAPGTQLSGHTA
jgi:hypothetical protein